MNNRAQAECEGLAALRAFIGIAEARCPAFAKRNRRFAELVGAEQAQARKRTPPPAEMRRYSRREIARA